MDDMEKLWHSLSLLLIPESGNSLISISLAFCSRSSVCGLSVVGLALPLVVIHEHQPIRSSWKCGAGHVAFEWVPWLTQPRGVVWPDTWISFMVMAWWQTNLISILSIHELTNKIVTAQDQEAPSHLLAADSLSRATYRVCSSDSVILFCCSHSNFKRQGCLMFASSRRLMQFKHVHNLFLVQRLTMKFLTCSVIAPVWMVQFQVWWRAQGGNGWGHEAGCASWFSILSYPSSRWDEMQPASILIIIKTVCKSP